MNWDERFAASQSDWFWVWDGVTVVDDDKACWTHDGSDQPLVNQVVRTRVHGAALSSFIQQIQPMHPSVSRWMVTPCDPVDELQQLLPTFGYTPTFRGAATSWPTTRTLDAGKIQVVKVHDRATLHDSVIATARGFERPKSLPESDYDRQVALCTGPSARTARFVAYDSAGTPIGAGGINRYDALGIGFLWAGCVAPEARGKGVYRALLAARAEWGRSVGLQRVGLYANDLTSRPIVERIGFDTHGPMTIYDRSSSC